MATSNNTTNSYPLSSSQQDIWFDQLLHPDVPLYNIGGYLRIDGPINLALFEKALNQVILENDALRLILQEGETLPTQTVADPVPLQLNFYDFSETANAHQSAQKWMETEFVKPFPLYNQLLFQSALLKLSEKCYYYFYRCHHLIVDGWAISQLAQRLATAYNRLGDSQPLTEQKCYSYLDWVKNDQAYLESDKLARHERYWLEKYQTLPAPRRISRQYATSFKSHTIPSQRSILHLSRSCYNQLTDFATTNQVTTFHLFIGVLYCYFVRTCDRGDLVIGLPVLNRSTAAFKQTVGLFASVSPAWFRFGTQLNFVELIQAIRQELQKDYRHQRFPISTLNKRLKLHKEGRRQLFDIMLSYAKHDYDIHFNGKPAHAVYFTHGFEQNALAIFIEEFHQDDGVNIYFDYNLGFFAEEEIERLKARFEFMLAEILQKPSVPLVELQIMPEAEIHQILVEFNDTKVDYQGYRTMKQVQPTHFQDKLHPIPP